MLHNHPTVLMPSIFAVGIPAQVPAAVMQLWNVVAAGQRRVAITPPTRESAKPASTRSCHAAEDSSEPDEYSRLCVGLATGLQREGGIEAAPNGLATSVSPASAALAQGLYNIATLLYNKSANPGDHRFLLDAEAEEGHTSTAAQQYNAIRETASSISEQHTSNDVVAGICGKHSMLVLRVCLVLHIGEYVLKDLHLPDSATLSYKVSATTLMYAHNLVGLLLMPLIVFSAGDYSNVVACWPLIPDFVRTQVVQFAQLRSGPLPPPRQADDASDCVLPPPVKRPAHDQLRPSGGAGSRLAALKLGLGLSTLRPTSHTQSQQVNRESENVLLGIVIFVPVLTGSCEALAKASYACISAGLSDNRRRFEGKRCPFTLPISLTQQMSSGKIHALQKLAPSAKLLVEDSKKNKLHQFVCFLRLGKVSAMGPEFRSLAAAMLTLIMAESTPQQRELITPDHLATIPHLYDRIWVLAISGELPQYFASTAPDFGQPGDFRQ
ncbi:hypothetical protein HaLaN_24096, partial [Haematococcus lacustris]